MASRWDAFTAEERTAIKCAVDDAHLEWQRSGQLGFAQACERIFGEIAAYKKVGIIPAHFLTMQATPLYQFTCRCGWKGHQCPEDEAKVEAQRHIERDAAPVIAIKKEDAVPTCDAGYPEGRPCGTCRGCIRMQCPIHGPGDKDYLEGLNFWHVRCKCDLERHV